LIKLFQPVSKKAVYRGSDYEACLFIKRGEFGASIRIQRKIIAIEKELRALYLIYKRRELKTTSIIKF